MMFNVYRRQGEHFFLIIREHGRLRNGTFSRTNLHQPLLDLHIRLAFEWQNIPQAIIRRCVIKKQVLQDFFEVELIFFLR